MIRFLYFWFFFLKVGKVGKCFVIEIYCLFIVIVVRRFSEIIIDIGLDRFLWLK